MAVIIAFITYALTATFWHTIQLILGTTQVYIILIRAVVWVTI
jgi:hypothetical protein